MVLLELGIPHTIEVNWSKTLEQRQAQETLGANVLRRVVLGLSGDISHRPPELQHRDQAASNA